MRISLIICVAASLTGCASFEYAQTRSGEFAGQLEVRWIKPDIFIYEPNPKNPLRFVTSDGRTVIPKRMVTDGGSIPRLFWGVPGYSPWGLAPAYIIHDWLFEAHQCRFPEESWVSFDDSARILGEGIKTMMTKSQAPEDSWLFYSIVTAVSSPIARELWNDGTCDPVPEEPSIRAAQVKDSVVIQSIDFSKPQVPVKR